MRRARLVGSLCLGFACTLGQLYVQADESEEFFPLNGARLNDAQVNGSLSSPVELIDPSPEAGREVITERYSDGSVQIERQVTRDDANNYVNDGQWNLWSEDGTLVGGGEYEMGKRQGRWVRLLFDSDEVDDNGQREPFSDPAYRDFERPFVSEATFKDGQLNGAWTISDDRRRKIVSWEFKNGKLDGKAIWWHPNGAKSREIEFDDGVIDGEFVEWDENYQLIKEEKYSDGRKRVHCVEKYPTGEKYSEGWKLQVAEQSEVKVDWWNTVVSFEVVGSEGQEQRFGTWVFWHENGKKLAEGNFVSNRPVGKHTWWFPNGQKQAEGSYLDGNETGVWIWWYENGQRRVEGEYVAGAKNGEWLAWHEDGQVLETQSHKSQTTLVAAQPASATQPVSASVPQAQPQNAGQQTNPAMRVIPRQQLQGEPNRRFGQKLKNLLW